MSKRERRARLTINLDATDLDALHKLAASQECTTSEFLRRHIRRLLGAAKLLSAPDVHVENVQTEHHNHAEVMR